MTTRDRDYQLMMGALADVARRRDAELAGAEQAYQENAARAAGELARAEGEAVSADRWAGAAAAQVLEVDREAGRLWEQLRRARGLRIRALGELPDPAPVETLPRVALQRRPPGVAGAGSSGFADAGSPGFAGAGSSGLADGGAPGFALAGRDSANALLARALERIEDTVRPAARRPLPRWVLPLLPVLGALVGGGTGLFAAGLVTFGGTGVPGGVLIRGLGWLAFLVAPSGGVPVAALVAHRRLEARLDIGGIALTLLGGMVAATVLSLLFATR